MTLREQIADAIGQRVGGVYTSRHTLLDCADAVEALIARALAEAGYYDWLAGEPPTP